MRELRAPRPAARVIVLTSFADDDRLLPAIRAGRGRLPAQERRSRRSSPRAIRAAHAGEALLDPGGRGAARRARSRSRRGEPPPERLTAARARGARADRARLLEQADRARARRRGEDGQDPRRPRAREARRHRPHPGGAARGRAPGSSAARVLGPIALATATRARLACRGMPTAIVTGASRGLGLRARRARSPSDGWRLVIDARGADGARARAPRARPRRRGRRARRRRRRPRAPPRARRGRRRRDRPARQQREHPRAEPAAARSPTTRSTRSSSVYDVNVLAPLGAHPARPPAPARRRRAIVNVTSDAAVEPYPGWGGYGSSKAALEQLDARCSRAEQPELRVYAVDPGDMRTQMHQDAFPGEDISDRPLPEDERARACSR